MDTGAWWATVHGVTKSQRQQTTHTQYIFFNEIMKKNENIFNEVSNNMKYKICLEN